MQRENLKSLKAWQHKRRTRALEAQKNARGSAREKELRLRREQNEAQKEKEQLEHHSVEEEGMRVDDLDENQKSDRRSKRSETFKGIRKFYAEKLSLMEWLIDVPHDLHSNWYVLPRPEGPRCLLLTDKGTTVSRSKDGNFHKKFKSALPNGSNETKTRYAASKCMLDTVFSEADQVFYVLDCICWDDYSLVNCEFEFRRFWLSDKLSELNQTLSDFRLELIPMEIATEVALMRAYQENLGYIKDGFIFVHKESRYVQGQTPLCLQWKDTNTSRYPIDTNANGKVLEKQSVVLQLNDDMRSVSSGDDDPIVLGELPRAFIDKNANTLKSRMLLRFNIGEKGLFFGIDGKPTGADLELVGVSVKRRLTADIISKIIFNYLCRLHQITFQVFLSK